MRKNYNILFFMFFFHSLFSMNFFKPSQVKQSKEKEAKGGFTELSKRLNIDTGILRDFDALSKIYIQRMETSELYSICDDEKSLKIIIDSLPVSLEHKKKILSII